MTGVSLTRISLANGTWEGLLKGGPATPPRLLVRHRDRAVGEADTRPGDANGQWHVSFTLPVECLSDGVETFTVEDAATGEALAHEVVMTGEAGSADIRVELDLLRAELDLLKRAFRRHCAEPRDD